MPLIVSSAASTTAKASVAPCTVPISMLLTSSLVEPTAVLPATSRMLPAVSSSPELTAKLTDESKVISPEALALSVVDAAAPLNILYIADVTDTSIYDAKFTEAYAMRLASDVAYEITSSQTVVASASAAYATLIQEARLVDAQETTSASEDTWLSARA